MDDRVIFVIREYIDGIPEPSSNWPKYEFQKNSYMRWAALETLKCILERPNTPPIKTVKAFANRMYQYSVMDHNDRNSNFIFYTAHDVATDILDILRAMN